MAKKRKIKRYVIDVNSYISIFLNKETKWLLEYIDQNNIEIFTDKHLFIELQRVLNYSKIRKNLTLKTSYYLDFVKVNSTQIISKKFQIKCPDIADNYLFDIALSANAKLLVTGDKVLLNWAESPVETISLSMFKKLF